MFMVTSFRLLCLAAYVVIYSAYNSDLYELSALGETAFLNYLGEVAKSFPFPDVSTDSLEETTNPTDFVTITLPHPGSKAITNIQGRKYPKTTTFHNIKYAKSPTENLR